jgi:competence protein ComEC
MLKRFDIPPTLSLTFFLSLGITFGFYFENKFALYFILPLIIGQLAVFYFRKKIKYYNVLFFVVSCLVFANLGLLRIQNYHVELPKKFLDKQTFIEAKVMQVLKPNAYQNRYEIKTKTINSQTADYRFILKIDKKKFQKLDKYDAFTCIGQISRLPNNESFGGFNYTLYLNKKGIKYQLFNNQKFVANQDKTDLQKFLSVRNGLAEFIDKSTLSIESKDIVKALTLGEKLELNETISQSFSNTGIIHILAISGLHIGMISAMLLWLLKPLKRVKKFKYFPYLLAILALWVYAFAVGFTPSVVRAVTMFSFINIGLMMSRKSAIINTIAASMLLLLLFNPYYLFDVGFQLSYAAVIAIVLFYPILKKWYYPQSKIFSYFYDILLVSFTAQLGVLPISLYYFHQLPGLFLIANLLAIPMLSLLLVFGFAFLFFAFFKIEISWLSDFLNFIIKYFIKIINYLSGFDQFILKDIYLSTFNLFISILLLLVFYSYLYSKKIKFLSLSLLLILIMQVSHLTNKYLLNNKPQFILIQKKDDLAVFQNNNRDWFFYSTNHQAFDKEKNLIFSYYYATKIKEKPFRNFYVHRENKVFLVNQSNLNLNLFPSDILIFPQGVYYNKDRFSKERKQHFYFYKYKSLANQDLKRNVSLFEKTLLID